MQARVSEVGARSYLTPIGYQSGSCGYCKDEHSSQGTPDSRASYYAASSSLHVDHYQKLVDRGWRRSGNTFYKPDVRRSCCPHYTIRLPATQLKPAKDQRQALNRWNRFVLGETYVKETARLYPKSKVDKARQRNDFDLLSTVHESEYNTLKKPPEPEHRFEVSLEPDDFTEEKFRLFEDYQKNVHHDPPSQISRGSFKRFLCSSPLRRVSCSVNGIKQDHGSFHQCYRLDGRLIAMAVLDLLPHCVSGVYFLYHRDFEKWSFGKLSAMREAALAVEKGYEHYYMGYYIHSCAKMRYKGDYKPQFILDLETLQWNAMDDEMRALLDTQKYVSISRERRLATEQNEATEADKSEPDKHSGATVDQQYLFDDPAEAADSGLSLFDLTMPGMMTANEVMEHIDLDHMSLEIRGAVHRMEQLVSWQEGSLTDSKSLKGIVAELAACVGPDVSREITIKFG